MDIGRFYLVVGAIIAGFFATSCAMLENVSLQWPGMDDFIWPTGAVLLVISTVATALPFIPAIKRAIAASPYKRSYTIGYLAVALYTGIGFGTLVLLPFRMASGI
jgi:hypothetical protein